MHPTKFATTPRRLAFGLSSMLAAASTGCIVPTPPKPTVPLTVKAPLCTGGMTHPCLEPARVEKWLRARSLRILDRVDTHRGIQDASILTLQTFEGDERIVFRAKWRPQSAAQLDYSEPRVAIAAYHLQKLLVPSERYVIPPTAGHCFPIANYRALVDPEADETHVDSRCVWGGLAFWIETADQISSVDDTDWYDQEGAYDPELYENNRIYRQALGTVNLLTYLTDNGDAHYQQFLVRPDRRRPHVYLVDNSMGFGAKHNSALEGTEEDWTTILVDLPGDSLNRLFAWTEEDYRQLHSVERHRLTEEGLVDMGSRRVEIDPSWLARQQGFHWDDDILHVGLTQDEIEALRGRVERLRVEAEAERLPVLAIDGG